MENKINQKQLEKISEWAQRNAPAIIAIAVTSVVGSVLGFVAGVGIYAFMSYYKKGD